GRRLVGVVPRRGLLLRRTGAGSLVGRDLALLRGQRLGLGSGLTDGRQVVGGRLVGVVAPRGLGLGLCLGLGLGRYAAGLLGCPPGLGGRLRPVLGLRPALVLVLRLVLVPALILRLVLVLILRLVLLAAGPPRGAP